MCLKIKLLLLLLPLLGVVQAAAFVKCPTEERCVSLNMCPQLLDKIKAGNMTLAQRNNIRNKQCGLKTPSMINLDRRIYVCCPLTLPPGNILPSNGECGVPLANFRIFGGTKTDLFEFPWMALIRHQRPMAVPPNTFQDLLKFFPEEPKFFRCGGSLINSRYVLTAAHCVASDELIESGMVVTSVRLGEWNIESSPDCFREVNGKKFCAPSHQDIEVEKRIVHPRYVRHGIGYDIALLRLKQSVSYTKNIKPICLPDSGTPLSSHFQIAGWGRTENGQPSPVMLKTTIEGRSLDVCREKYRNIFMNDGQLCAGGIDRNDTCKGDSGGPLMATVSVNSRELIYLAGITSHGPRDCGRKGWPAVYTRTGAFITWIKLNVRA